MTRQTQEYRRFETDSAQAREDGHKRAILILDAAYQFAVSVGIDVPTGEVA